MPLRTDGISQLRMHRISIPGARYFITCVTKDRHSGLTTPLIWSKLLHHCQLSEADFHAVVCMPDHFHALFVLPRDTTPGSIVRTLKGPLTPPIRKRNLHWQKNFFEHRLRENETTDPYLRYMLCNPYRAQLLATNEVWPYWKILSNDAQWFVDKFPKQRPEPEWLALQAPWKNDSNHKIVG